MYISSIQVTGRPHIRCYCLVKLVARVSDDLYFMYGSLSSGKDTLFVTNDRLGDHLQNIDKPLIPIFQKWLRSSCVTHDELPHWRGLQVMNE